MSGQTNVLADLLARSVRELGRVMVEGQYDDATRHVGARIVASIDEARPDLARHAMSIIPSILGRGEPVYACRIEPAIYRTDSELIDQETGQPIDPEQVQLYYRWKSKEDTP